MQIKPRTGRFSVLQKPHLSSQGLAEILHVRRSFQNLPLTVKMKVLRINSTMADFV